MGSTFRRNGHPDRSWATLVDCPNDTNHLPKKLQVMKETPEFNNIHASNLDGVRAVRSEVILRCPQADQMLATGARDFWLHF